MGEATQDLEYKVGGLNIDASLLKGSRYISDHKFVVEAVDNVVSIYVAEESRHRDVVKEFGLKSRIVGGGNCYLDSKKRLGLGGDSGDFDAIPEKVAQRFVELVASKLREQGIQIDETIVEMSTHSYPNQFWRERGE